MTRPACKPRNGPATSVAVARSHTRTDPSRPPVTAVVPSAVTATDSTSLVWPASLASVREYLDTQHVARVLVPDARQPQPADGAQPKEFAGQPGH